MRKLRIISFIIVMAVVVPIFAGCAKISDMTLGEKGTPVSIIVSPTDTKTVNNGQKTEWEKGDEISVFHAVSGGSFSQNEKFTVTDAAQGKFSGTVSGNIEASKSYDWYAIYPYTSSIPSPDNNGGGGGYITVGEKIQVQNALDSRAHLAGDKMSAWACAKGISGSSRVTLTMHQFASVIAVKVTNRTDSDVEISNVSITADKNIAGTYFADITGESPVLVPSGEGNVYKSVNLNVFDAVLPTEASAKFYLAVTPFSASSLKVCVNGMEKTLSFDQEVFFQAGHIKTLPFDLDESGTGDAWTRVTAVSDITSGGTFIIGYEAEAKSGVIVPMRASGTASTTAGGYMYAGTGSNTTSDKTTLDMSDVTQAEKYEVKIVPSTEVSGAVCIKVGNFYIGNDNSKNKCMLYSTQSAYTSFSASVGKDDAVTLKIEACKDYNVLQYNPSSPRFTIYSGTQQEIVLYKKSGSGGDDSQFHISTLSATAVTSCTASLGASYSNAEQVPSNAYFKYGTSSSALTETVYCNESLTSLSGSFTASLNGLSASTTYYYKAYVQVGDTTLGGTVCSFTTSAGSSGDPTSSRGWFELPRINDSDNNRIDDKNSTYYYAYHLFSNGSSKRRNYTVCYSSQHHCPLWVAAPRHSCYEGGSGRSSYSKDPDIPSNIQYSNTDTGGGCNKGHMLGSAERTCSKEANKQVFYYTNIAPQYSSGYNTGGGGWNKLEDYIDTKVCADTLYEVVGCYFDDFTDGYGYSASSKTISFGGRNDVHCPTMFYYAVLRTKRGNTGKSVKNCTADELQCVAFVRSHNNGLKGQSVSQKEMMSIADLEKLTGFEYFTNVPNVPKSTFNPSDWL